MSTLKGSRPKNEHINLQKLCPNVLFCFYKRSSLCNQPGTIWQTETNFEAENGDLRQN